MAAIDWEREHKFACKEWLAGEFGRLDLQEEDGRHVGSLFVLLVPVDVEIGPEEGE